MSSPSRHLIVAPGGLQRFLWIGTLWVVVGTPYLGVAAVVWFLWNWWFSWVDVLLLVATYLPIAAGVTVGMHRYFTHRSFETNRVVRLGLAVLALLALEGTITQWVANHLWHHTHSDTDDDLHSPIHGLWHAHTGWIFQNRAADPRAFGISRALVNDRDIQFLDRFSWFFALVSIFGVLPIGYAVGGWPGALSAFLLGGLIRFFLVHHFTWAINSVCHVVGARPYRSNDGSTNLAVLAWPTLGESFHRTHHAFPWSALQGTAWWNDPSYAIIRTLAFFGWAWNIRVPTAAQYLAKRAAPPVIPSDETTAAAQ
jgi:stearoyl-CoA desaturase (delta-9 desaturase)